MTTVSLVEIKSPASLRSCGSSISSLVQRRTRLQCFSPDKLAAAYKARTAEPRSRVSVSPKLLGLEGTQLVSSPAESPVPHPSVTPYSGRQSRFGYDEFSDESLDELSDDDIDAEQDGEHWNADDKQRLFVVGSRQKLHCPYDVPNLKADISRKSTPSIQYLQDPFPAAKKSAENQLNRDDSSSPDNPPPSPVNYRPSLEGFIVGGQKLLRPEKSTIRQGTFNNSRDFVPGFVKYPLGHCNKCEGRVVEEQQTEAVLQRRRSILLQSRISAHKLIEMPIDAIQSVGSGLPVDSPMLQGSLDGLSSELISPNPSSYYDKTFIEIYMEKKRIKEEKDKEIAEEKKRSRETRRHGKRTKKKARMATKVREKDGVNIGLISEMNNVMETTQCGIRDELVVKSLEKVYKSRSYHEDSDEMLIPSKTKTRTGQFFNKASLELESQLKPQTKLKQQFRPCGILRHALEVEKLQIRRCWSDIWPFPGDTDSYKQAEDDQDASNFGVTRNKSRITPFYPLNRSPAFKSSESTTFSCESLTSNQSNYASSPDDVLMLQRPLQVGIKNGKVKVPSPKDHDSTTKATVIVPSQDTLCNQWISFGAGNEPVLNNIPDVDDGSDTFLKRLQRIELCETVPDPSSLPTGQEFCFEAVVDKRYNRWKRRRRKKKDGEHRQDIRPLETESSDENDERNSQVERILDRMYDQIHGPPPSTPNGTRDTPRLRNRRRRHELQINHVESAMTSAEPTVTNYDASSEWTSSDRDSGPQSSNSGSGHCFEKLINVTMHTPIQGKSSDDLCNWPFIEQYKQEMMKKIQNTSSEQLEAMDQKEWLPDITSHYHKKSPRTGYQSEGVEKDVTENEVGREIDKNLIVLSKERSDATSSDTSNQSPKYWGKSVETVVITKNMSNPNIYKRWSRTIQQPPRNPKTPSQSTRLLSRAVTSSWGEIGASKKTAQHIGVVEVGQNYHDSTFKASLRPIKCDNVELSSQTKQEKKSLKDQPKSRGAVNLPALSKTLKSHIVPQTFRKATPTKGRKKPQSPMSGKVPNMKQQFPRPKTQRLTAKKGQRADHVDPNLLFRDYYLKTLYNERMRINSHIGPHSVDKPLKRTITVDQLNIGSKKNRTDDDKLSDLAFTRSFTFSMFDLPEVYKMYNSSLLQRAQEEVIETID